MSYFAQAAIESDYGGSKNAIEYHYDVGQEFYELWLDETLTYSCAQWSADIDAGDLKAAQENKIRAHLDAANVKPGSNVLDIGCGWGALMKIARKERHVGLATGLTLSEDQFSHICRMGLSGTKVRLEHWADHLPTDPYDAIVSIGAFEHFAKPEQTVAEKISVYADFFHRCHQWLAPGGRMSLQTIAYGTMRREDASPFINNEIFPAADLPSLAEIVQAAEGIFEITRVSNDRLHYSRTLECWGRRLAARRQDAVRLVGEDVTSRYERYLKQTAVGFHMGKIGLLRIALRPITGRWGQDARW